MSKVIYKYDLDQYQFAPQVLTIPKGRILKVDEQDGILMLWALIDTDEPNETYKIEVLGTGEELPELERLEMRHHLNTVVMSDGLVWHVFQILKVSPKS